MLLSIHLNFYWSSFYFLLKSKSLKEKLFKDFWGTLSISVRSESHRRSHTSKMESFATSFNGKKLLVILGRLFILNVYGGPSYVSKTFQLVWYFSEFCTEIRFSESSKLGKNHETQHISIFCYPSSTVRFSWCHHISLTRWIWVVSQTPLIAGSFQLQTLSINEGFNPLNIKAL